MYRQAADTSRQEVIVVSPRCITFTPALWSNRDEASMRIETRIEPTGVVTLAVGGMTCASCAARIEKQLNRIDGVHASVNFATERAALSEVFRTIDEESIACFLLDPVQKLH